MAQQMHSQNTLTKEPRVTTIVNSKGDTLIQLKLSDAKIILKDVLDRRVLDSMVNAYSVSDSLKTSTIMLQVSVIKVLQEKSGNQQKLMANLDKIITNKDNEIGLLNNVVKTQKKEIRHQKFLKIVGFITAVVIPIAILIFIK
jgi:hypothetical protein